MKDTKAVITTTIYGMPQAEWIQATIDSHSNQVTPITTLTLTQEIERGLKHADHKIEIVHEKVLRAKDHQGSKVCPNCGGRKPPYENLCVTCYMIERNERGKQHE